VQRSKKKDGDP